MKRGMTRWFAIVVALQVAFIAAEWGKYTVQAESGEKVVLKVVPVDPRSLFMGNYMALDLEVERINPRAVGLSVDPKDNVYGKVMYVGLEPRSPYARVVSVTPEVPTPRREGIVYMRGRVMSFDTAKVRGRTVVSAIRLDYGIDRYYFPESRQADFIEKTRARAGRLPEITATVSVTDSGRPILQKLHVNGETVEF